MTKPKTLPRKIQADGLISLDIFETDVGVWFSNTPRVEALKFMGVAEPAGANQNFLGVVCLDFDEEDFPILTMVISPRAGIDTWAHEAVHLADMLMDSRGVPTDIANTEVRAYITGYATQQIAMIMQDHQEREARKAAKALPSKEVH